MGDNSLAIVFAYCVGGQYYVIIWYLVYVGPASGSEPGVSYPMMGDHCRPMCPANLTVPDSVTRTLYLA